MNNRFWIDAGLLLVFLLMQILVFQHLEISGLQTDVVLIFLIWLSSVRSRTYSIVMAALAAIFMDVLLDTWGVHLFSKTLIVLAAHTFINRQVDNILQPIQVFVVVLVIALVYNIIFLTISSFAGIYSLELFFLKYWIGNSVYIAVIATLMFMLKPDEN